MSKRVFLHIKQNFSPHWKSRAHPYTSSSSRRDTNKTESKDCNIFTLGYGFVRQSSSQESQSVIVCEHERERAWNRSSRAYESTRDRASKQFNSSAILTHSNNNNNHININNHNIINKQNLKDTRIEKRREETERETEYKQLWLAGVRARTHSLARLWYGRRISYLLSRFIQRSSHFDFNCYTILPPHYQLSSL